MYLNSCGANVGRVGYFQLMSIGEHCFQFPIILHEIGHSIGFFHEQSRRDRDKYVTIHEQNIKPGLERQFHIRNDTNSLGVTYDLTVLCTMMQILLLEMVL